MVKWVHKIREKRIVGLPGEGYSQLKGIKGTPEAKLVARGV